MPPGATAPARRGGRGVREGPAKPRTPVQFRSPPPRLVASTARALSSGGERFLDAEEVRGSNPLAPTREPAGQAPFLTDQQLASAAAIPEKAAKRPQSAAKLLQARA